MPAYALTVASRLVTRLPLRHLSRLILRLTAVTAGESPPERHVAAIRAAVDHVQESGWPLVEKSCLPRGVTLLWLLRRAGLDVALAFGVGRADGEAAAHCWIVRDGQPFLEPTDPTETFTELWRIGPDDRISGPAKTQRLP